MFEEYLEDAADFFDKARKAGEKEKDREARRYYRAAVFYSASAMEAFVNYIADSFEKAQTPSSLSSTSLSLSTFEIAFINDKNLVFQADKLEVIVRTEYHRLEDKIRFLLKKFDPKFDFNKSPDWSRLMEFKSFRDSLVHPRKGEDDTSVQEYHKKVKAGLAGVIGVMNSVSEVIYKRPLRKKILDLIPN